MIGAITLTSCAMLAILTMWAPRRCARAMIVSSAPSEAVEVPVAEPPPTAITGTSPATARAADSVV